MRKSKGFTLIELLIVMAVIAILIAIAIPSFRGMQNEARKTKAQGDLRVLKVAVESYYKNNNNVYPVEASYQTTLLAASPRILETNLYDPFGATSTTDYVYDTDTGVQATAKYYILYSIGPETTAGTAVVNTSGTVTASNGAIWESNGHL
ncbi:type II secretion system protein [Candidatus Margulisiibacteriota bacterium]